MSRSNRAHSHFHSARIRKNPKGRQLRLQTLEDRTVPTAYTWTTAVSGNFNDPSKWTPVGVPGAGDDATISQTSVTVTSPATTTVQSLTNAATLSVSAGTTFTVTNGGSDAGTISVASGATFDLTGGAMGWTGGTITGSGTFHVASPASLNLSGSANKDLTAITLNNDGSISLGGTGSMRTGSDAVLNNAGTFSFTSDADVTFFTGTRPNFNNSGLVTKSSAFGLASAFNTFFNNLGGTISVTSGELDLNAGTSTGGTFNVDAGAILDWTGGSNTQNIAGTFTGSGGGAVRLANGALNVTLTNAALNFPAGLFQWSGGTIAGLSGSTLTNNGTITISSPNNKDLSTVLLNNNGTIIVGGTGSWRGGTTTITNGGTIDFQSDASLSFGFATRPVLNNTGTVKKSGGIGTTSITATVNNNAGGTIAAQSGILSIDAGGASASSFTMTSGSSVQLTSDFTFNAGASASGPGQLSLANGNLIVAAPTTVENLGWTAGGIAASAGLTVNGTLAMSGGSNHDMTGTVTSNGTATLGGTGYLRLGNGATFQNNGSFTFLSDALVQYGFGSSGNAFNNAGTVTKTSSTSTGASGFSNLDFNSTGTVNVASGVLFIDRGTSSGSWNVAPAASLQFNTGTTTLNAGTSINGTGIVNLPSGTVVFNSDVSINNLKVTGGVTAGSGTVTVENSLGWTAGGFAGDLTVAPGATLAMTGGSNKDLSAATLTNYGTATFAGSGAFRLGNAATLRNLGTFDIQTTAPVQYGFGSSNNRVVNVGLLTKSAGGGTAQLQNVELDNTGTVDVSNGTLQMAGPVTQLNSGTLSGGTWQADAGASLILQSNVTTNSATVILNGAGSAIPQINGMTTNNGTFRVTGGRAFSTGGALTNNGTIRVGPLSTVTVAGTYTQNATGKFVSEIGGQPASGQFGQLNSTGAATLNGTVEVDLVNGFGPNAGGNFQIMSYASETGNFTFVSPSTPKQGDLFAPVVNATSLVAQSIVNAADLAVTDIFVPATATPGTDAGIGYVVKNLSTTATVVTDWVDSVYLSKDSVLDPSDILVERVAHSGTLNAGDTYNGQTTVALPGVNTGEYHVIVVADGRSFVPDTNRPNNTLASPATVSVTVPVINIGQQVNGTITNGEDIYYRVDLPPGKTVRVGAGFGVASEMEMYVGYKYVPTRTTFDQSTFPIGETAGQIILPSTQAGPYYILLHGRESAAAGNAFSLQVDIVPFGILGLDNAKGSNAGKATVTIHGAGFTPSTTARLVSGPVVRNASQVLFKDANTVFATFDLAGLGTGTYDLTAIDGASADTRVGGFTVTTGNPGRLEFHVSAPAITRALTATTVTVEYANVGDTDVTAPLLDLTADWAIMRLPEQEDYVGKSVQFVGINPDGPAGILPAGFRGSITFPALSVSAGAHVGIKYDLRVASDNAGIDWTSHKAEMRPDSIPADAWDAVFANFVSQVGNTTASYRQAIADDATYLSQFGDYTYDITRFQALEYVKADAAVNSGDLGASVDARVPTPGLPLAFERVYRQDLAGRYGIGRLGRGWSDNWDIAAKTAQNGDVTISGPGGGRFFQRNADGSYAADDGDNGLLTVTGGLYTLTQPDGQRTTFRADGRIDAIQDANGNRVSATYDGTGRLNRLTHTSGAFLDLSYDTNGRVAAVTDSTSRVSTYTYDASGEHLIGYAGPDGAESYAYLTGQGPATEHALSAITSATGTHLTYEYDGAGRLAAQQFDGGVSRITFAYGTAGGYSSTNADGGRTTFSTDDTGQLRQLIDPLGRVLRHDYDSAHNLLREIRPDGTTYEYGYDARGNLTQVTDPLGNTTLATYDAAGHLLSETDARGNTTAYGYDARGNLTRLTYSDGTFEQYGYDAVGNRTTWVNARGQTLQYGYNSMGLLTSKTFADTSTATFAYDARGRLLTATDSTGTYSYTYTPQDHIATFTDQGGHTLSFEYNAAGQRTRSTDQLGFVVNYVYDAAGRLDQLRDGANNLIVDYSYDPVSRLAREDKGNGTFTTYTYDLAGNLLNLTNHQDGATVNSSFDFEYDVMNNRTAATTGSVRTNYGYDALGRLASVDSPGQTVQYAYDAVGNRTSVTDNGVVTMYAVNARNQYTAVGGTTYLYDADGNRTAATDAGGTTAYTFSQENRVTGVSGPGLTAAYAYDPLGNLVSQTIGGTTTDFQVDPNGLGDRVAAYAGAALLSHYVYGNGLVSRVDPVTGAEYYDFDAGGNTVGITDGTQQYVSQFSYRPFGLASTVGPADSFTYAGRFGVATDGAGGFAMRARDYDPVLGRFLSADPLHTGNLYAYADNNPLSYGDPDGFRPEPNVVHINDPKADSGNYDFNSNTIYVNDYYANASPHWKEITEAHERAHWDYENNLHPKDPHGGVADEYYAHQMGAWKAYELKDLAGYNYEKYFVDYIYKNHKVPPAKKKIPRLPPPPTPPGGSGGSDDSDNRTANDPNELVGPAGAGAAGFVSPSVTLPYTIRFENKPDASLPAQVVNVTQTLNANLDLDTFQLTKFNFGSYSVDIPAGRDNYKARVDARATTGLFADITASLDRNTRVLTIVYESIDPTTLDRTADPLAGFLPPDNANHDGQGYVSYTVRAKAGLATGVDITATPATVTFDNLPSLDTNSAVNTIDAGSPTATITALPDVETALTFPVSWTGTDDAGGSGVGTFDVYVSDNGGPWTLWQNQTAALSANFTGELFHSYAFYAVGYDNVGNVEPNIPATESITIATDGAYARNDVYAADAGKTLTITSKAGLLANDPKKAGKTYAVQPALTNPAHGTLTLKPDGSFVYVPNGTFAGLDSFTYQTKDSDGLLGNVATVTLATQLVNFNTVKVSAPEAKGLAKLIVALRKPATAVTTVDYSPIGGTATTGVDFDATSATVTFQPGEKTKTIIVPVVNDTIDEPDQTFQVVLKNAAGAVVGMKSAATVTIKDDDLPPTVGFSTVSSSVGEGVGTVTIAVTLSAVSEKTVTVKYAAGGGTATNGADYTLTAGTLTFAPGETTKLITLTITQDTLHEANETVLVKLSKPTNAKLSKLSVHTLTITDDDP
jgi:RHS repeat-associated protein